MILFALALAWIAGVLLCAFGGLAASPLLPGIGLAFGLGLAVGGQRRTALLAVMVGVVAVLGMLRYEAGLPQVRDGIAAYNDGGEAVFRGLVTSVDERERVQLVRVQAEAIQLADGSLEETAGDALLTLPLYPERRYGDRITVSGRLETPEPFDGFDYRAYLERKGIGSVMLYPRVEMTGTGGSAATHALLDVRERLSASIELSMREPEASIARGMLLGLRGSIPSDLGDDFNRSGLSHLIVISGQNMMLVASLVAGLLWPLFGRHRATVLAIVIVVLYAVLVGGSPPVVRATIMAVVVLGAALTGREGWSLRALAIAAAVMLVITPGLIRDVSFQLSVFATMGIILGASQIEATLTRLPGGFFATGFGRWMAEQMSITGSASLAVMPIMALAFGRVSLVALPANLLAAPLFGWLLAGSFATSLAGLVDQDLGVFVGQIARIPLTWFVTMARGFSGLPYATVEVGAVVSITATAVLALCLHVLWRRRSEEAEEPPAVRDDQKRLQVVYAAVIVAGLTVAIWLPLLEGTNGRLQVTLLDVGQGDAILVETPDGRVVLVDGGPSGSRLLNQLGSALPANTRRIDLVVLTHGQDDHVTGLIEMLERYEVGMVLMSDRQGTSGAFQAWSARVEQLGVPVVTASRGMGAELGSGVILHVLHPGAEDLSGRDDANENSVVLKLVYGEVSLLLTGDIGFTAEDALLAAAVDVRADVLKVGHHGSDGSTSARFLSAVEPELALISTGAENSYGHPSPTTRLRLAGIPVARTDVNGRIRLETDGARIWLDLERGRTELVPAGLGQK